MQFTFLATTAHKGHLVNDKTASLLRGAFDQYVELTRTGTADLEGDYLPYDDLSELDSVQWSLPGDMMVKDELRELINNLNQWLSSLRKWSAWNAVIASYADLMDAWEIRLEFVEGVAHRCLYKPSAMRDAFTHIATNAIHQVRLASDASYKDRLAGDPESIKTQKYPSRRTKEKNLSQLTALLGNSAEFMSALGKLDDSSYKRQTSDYRNRTSHAIGPRLGIGLTRAVVRSVVQATELQKQSDGTYQLVDIPGKTSVQYAIGCTEPLNMVDALEANREQYDRARGCYSEYRKMLMSGLAGMPPTTKL